MANWVTVACVSGRPVPARRGSAWSDVADRIVAAWRDRLTVVLADQPDIVVLPELCDQPALGPEESPYTPKELHDYYSERGPAMFDLLREVAVANHCYVTYPSVREDDGGRRWNSVQIISRDGEIVGTYDKYYLVVEENSINGLSYGESTPVFTLDFGTVACAVCFDLNFPDLCASYAAQRPDLILFPSMYHGGFVQSQWAYSCRSYLATSIYPPARSAILSPLGRVVAESTNYYDHVVARINLDRVLVHLGHNRGKLLEAKRRYGRGVRIDDPGLLGPVVLSSQRDDISAADIAAELGMELLDDYFDRSRRHRAAHVFNAAARESVEPAATADRRLRLIADGHPEADASIPQVGRVFMSICEPEIEYVGGEIRSAAQDAVVRWVLAGGPIDRRYAATDVFVSFRAPFPDVSDHLEEAEFIGRE